MRPAELAPLAAAFNDMQARLEDAFRRLSEFSSDIAHELRTPISHLMTQTLVSLSQARSADDYREIVYSSLEEYERMARMVSDMLFLAKTDNGQVIASRERVDLAAMGRELFEFYAGRQRARRYRRSLGLAMAKASTSAQARTPRRPGFAVHLPLRSTVTQA